MFGKHRNADKGQAAGKEDAQVKEPRIAMVSETVEAPPDVDGPLDETAELDDRPSMLARAGGIPETPRRSELSGGLPRRSADPRPNPEADGRKLHVGREISLTGEIKTCERLVVEGTVEASLTNSRVLEITATGVFKGSAEVDTAEVSGRFEGDLNVRDRLYVRCGGRVSGSVQYAEIQIERGGIIAGTVDVMSRKRASASAAVQPAADRELGSEGQDDADSVDHDFEREAG